MNTDASHPPLPVAPLREALKFYQELGAEFLAVTKPGGNDTLAAITREIMQCQCCRLHESKKNYVPGEGPARPDILFVGEGPGETEDKFGRPFIGKAGQLLDKIIEKMGCKRTDVFISNVVKCRPPANREPLKDEADACLPYLQRQIAVLQPRVIVCLGKVALNFLLDMNQPIGRSRGKALRYRDAVPVVATYHPSYILHKKDREEITQAKWEVWEDMQRVLALIGRGHAD